MAKKKSKSRARRSQGKRAPRLKKNDATKKTKAQARVKIPQPKTAQKTRKRNQRAQKTAAKAVAKTKKLVKSASKKPKLAKQQRHETRDIQSALRAFRSFLSEPHKNKPRKIPVIAKPVKKKKPAPKKGTFKKRAPKIEPRVSVRKLKSGEIRTISFDVPYQNLGQWLEDLEKNPTLDGQIPEGARLGFRFFGNNSMRLFNSVREAILVFGSYNTTLDAIDSMSAQDQLEIYKHIEFVIVDSSATWIEQNEELAKRRKASRGLRSERAREYKKTYWFRLKERNPSQYAAALARKRTRAKERREKLKNTPNFKAKQSAASRRYRRKQYE